MKEYVLGFMFSDTGGYVVLIRKARPAWQADKFNGVGGKVEPGELAHDAMVREFREETGVETKASDWRMFCKMDARVGEAIIYCFATRGEVFSTVTKTDEEVIVFESDDVSSVPTIDNIPWLVPLAWNCIEEGQVSPSRVEIIYS